MSRFVEQGDYIVVGEKRRLAADRAREVAIKVGHRRLDAVSPAAPRDGAVHPGSAALGFASIEVQIKLADEFAGRIADVEKANIFVPYRGARFLDMDAVERLDQLEHARDH